MEEYRALQRNIRIKTSLTSVFFGLFVFTCLVKLFIFYTFIIPSDSMFTVVFTGLMAVFSFISLIGIFAYLPFWIKVCWILFLSCLSISCIIHFNGIEYICNTISFLGVLTVLPYVKLKRNVIKSITGLLFLYGVIIIIFNADFGIVSLIEMNTNTVSVTLFIMQFCLFAFAVHNRGYRKILLYILALLCVGFQLRFGGRSSLLGTVLLFGYMIFRRYFNCIKRKTVRNLVIFICVFSVVFVYFYSVILFNIIGHGNVFVLGKDIFTGRQKIWTKCFECLKGNLLFGIGNSLITYMGEGTNLHNQILGYMSLYGLPSAILYVLLISGATEKLYSRSRNNFIVAFIIVLLVLCYFETALYSILVMHITMAMIILYYLDKNHKSVVKKQSKSALRYPVLVHGNGDIQTGI